MANQTFQGASVRATEIDLTAPGAVTPTGVPAGIIGTSKEGPAFVPITFASKADFNVTFGRSRGKQDQHTYSAIAVYEWLQNARSCTFLRVLGVGKGEKRSNSDGTVEGAGFVVGSRQVQPDGLIGHNSYAYVGGDPGRTYFLGAIMKETATDADMPNYFQDAGIDTYNSASILRGVLMAPSGVALTLSGWGTHQNVSASVIGGISTSSGHNAGTTFGAIDLRANGDQTFKMFLNGYKNSNWPSIIQASMDPNSSNYFGRKFNTDPAKIEERGHLLYADFPVYPAQARIVDGDFVKGANGEDERDEHRLFLVTGSAARNATDTAGKPNYEGFVERFSTGCTPWFVSQALGGKNISLFKIHSMDDGQQTGRLPSGGQFKISIENIEKSKTTADKYGTFDLVVRLTKDSDDDQKVVDEFRGLDLNPRSDNYIARRIGDSYAYFDFDKSEGSQKINVEGLYPLQSKRLIRVEMNPDFANGEVDETALPVGFRGVGHLVTSGSSFLSPIGTPGESAGAETGPSRTSSPDISKSGSLGMRMPPLPFRQRISDGATASTRKANSNYYWGIEYYRPALPADPNLTQTLNGYSIRTHAAFFPSYGKTQPMFVVGNEGAADVNGSIIDADLFNKNLFTLENILIKTQSASDVVDPSQWAHARYVRSGSAGPNGTGEAGFRFLNVAKDFAPNTANIKYYKFSCNTLGAFDGLNIFDAEKKELSNIAAHREMVDTTNQGATAGPTNSAYRKAVGIMAEKSDVDIQLLAIPGIRSTGVTDFAISNTEERFDALYLMDIEECNEFGSADDNVITGSSANEPEPPINVTNTIARLGSRNLDSSFAAAYFPDVKVRCLETDKLVVVPPSAAMLGAFSNNDKVAFQWYAPAGFSRGSLKTAVVPKVSLNEENRGSLYNADINPIVTYPGQVGVMCMGQKTLLKAQSALDRVNVRRLLINVRRQIKGVAETILFEPNRGATLSAFSAKVEPILARIQSQQGIDRYKVVIDTSTTTQTDIENNTIKGKIFLQPTRAVEFISLDFKITNAGAEI